MDKRFLYQFLRSVNLVMALVCACILIFIIYSISVGGNDLYEENPSMPDYALEEAPNPNQGEREIPKTQKDVHDVINIDYSDVAAKPANAARKITEKSTGRYWRGHIIMVLEY